MRGKRAPILTALLSRAPAAHVGFQPLQQLIWQIEGGFSYDQMPPQSKQLIDQLVPEFRNQVGEDFLTALRNRSNTFGKLLGQVGLGGAANIEAQAVNALVREYQGIHQTLLRYENNYQALAQQFVHVLPGTAPNPGPTAWSQLNSRVYARLVGGAIYGETAKLEVRVLSSAVAEQSAKEIKSTLKSVNYTPGSDRSSGSNAGTDLADVSLGPVIAYPNQAGSQVLGYEVESHGSPPSIACNNGFALNARYGSQVYEECIEGDQAAFNGIVKDYQGSQWPPLAAQAVYLWGVVNGTRAIKQIRIYSEAGEVTDPGLRYQIIYSTVMWGWEYNSRGLSPSSLQPYQSMQSWVQSYSQANWLRDAAVGATDLDAWLNPVYWLNQGVNDLFSLLGSGGSTDAETKLEKFLNLLFTLSRGYQYAASQIGLAGVQRALGDFKRSGICLQQGYTPSQFFAAMSQANAESVDWPGLATGLAGDVLGETLQGSPLVIANGTLTAGYCLTNQIGAVTLQQVAAGALQCTAKSAANDLAEFAAKQLTQQALGAAFAEFGAQDASDAASAAAVGTSGATTASGTAVADNLSEMLFVLNMAATLDESYNLPMANLVQQSMNAANAALSDFPTFFQLISELVSGGYASVGVAPLAVDTDGLLNTTLALLYQVNYQYCAGTLPLVGCQAEMPQYQTYASGFEVAADDILTTEKKAAILASSLPDTSAPSCSVVLGGPVIPASATSGQTSPFTSSMINPGGIPLARPAIGPSAPGRPAITQAIIQPGRTSLQLSPGSMYLYGMATGGAAPSSPFSAGPYAQALDAAGQVAAALAYGNNDQNSYTTATGFHVIGGVSIAGSWDSFQAFYGSNSQLGASNASVNFPVSENSLVVVIGLAASQQSVQLAGIPGLEIDASSSGPGASEGMVIGHAYLRPGMYTATEQSAALAGGQDPTHMADLVGVFVFGVKQ
jgi:hypothetical protein